MSTFGYFVLTLGLLGWAVWLGVMYYVERDTTVERAIRDLIDRLRRS